ncbi:TPA: hypothetical protein DCG29_02285 [Candidatus Nomurabacteria bacterium]|nr:MAG: hypothetical protein UR55_C0020G0002 [Candidatus Nomurabacteria bacterium GW2011_GWF1_34_20]KKP61514.1 MAG: hypothetical protein UR57_C0018G0002 [Candidatus Nomurabacteria bacterium GW2011_GWE2_34_25]HAE36662.1 hypothetical protein [Candidatus Nomurabacteria bacterium]HCU01250.1 hypothetical protein [Candidatus Nomurabacteria bacterium]
MEHKSETKNCQNCKKDFTIESEDFLFYKKIKVPSPTFCPECRFQRRMAYRNERYLHKRICDLCKENIISVHSAESPFPVYCNKCWWSDKWDSSSFGKEYDSSKTFFAQWHELMLTVPRPELIAESNVNCNYVNYSGGLKNCYFAVGCDKDEDCSYIYRTFNSKNSQDCFGLQESNLCYENIQSSKSFKSNFIENCENALESNVAIDCKNISNCIGCVNLRNAKNFYLNKPISGEEYKIKREELGSYRVLEKLKKDFKDLLLKTPRRFAKTIMSINSDGDELVEIKNCHNCFFVRRSENLKYAAFCSNIKDSYDYSHADNSELLYESANIEKNYNKLFSTTCWFSRDITYSDICMSSQELFGCICMRSKNYCILNKQYGKEEYFEMVEKIKKHMNDMPYVDHIGRSYVYGEFFPIELSPFAYHETFAQEYISLDKEEIIKQGYRCVDERERNYVITRKTEEIPDHIKDVDDSILEDIIACAHAGECKQRCTTAFKITSQELSFYRQINMPIPRLCPNCRHYERSSQLNPMKLWHRSCMKEGCTNTFETSYSPERPEIVYCEKCYQQEVY